jgi:hypothetical protein
MEHMKTAPKSSKIQWWQRPGFFCPGWHRFSWVFPCHSSPIPSELSAPGGGKPPSVTLVYKHQRLTQATEWGSILYHGAPGTFSAQCVRSWNLRPLDGNDGCEVLACNQFWD